MRRKEMAALVILAFLVAGCPTTPSSRRSLVVATETYAAVMETLAEYRRAGLIDDETAAQIEQHRRRARAALDAWRDAELAGGSTAHYVEVFDGALTELIEAEIAAREQEAGDG